MTRSFLFFYAVIFLFISNSFATNQTKVDIDKIITDADPKVNIGIKITNLDKKKVIYKQNEERYFVFASAIKIISVFSILDNYGENYSFTNYITEDNGDLYLHINDPDFSTQDLETMIVKLQNHLKNRQIGNFYIVNDQFTLPTALPERTYADSVYCYGAPISKVHINKNCTRLLATPTEIGRRIQLTRNEFMPYEINNHAITVSNKHWDRLNASVINSKYNVTGSLNHATGKVVIGAVIHNPASHVQSMLQKILELKQIRLKGSVIVSSKPNEGEVILTLSKKITDIAAKAIKKSNNFMCEYLLAHYATKLECDEWDKAAYYLKKLVEKQYGVNFADTVIHDASGLSRSNIMKVSHFDQFLIAISQKKNFKKKLKMLTIPAEDGTLIERFANGKQIYAKTGTLSNNTSLVGYFYNKNNELHSFVIVINNYYGSKNKYNKLIDDIIIAAMQ